MPQVSLKDTGRHHLPRNVGAISIVNTDLHLVCKDGVVNSHQAVLSWASGFLRRIFMSQLILEDGGKRKEDVTLHFPGFGVKIVTAVTNFLVTGELNVRAGKVFREEFEEAWEAFRIDRISFKEVFEAGRSYKRPSTTTTLIQNCVGLPNRRPMRSSRTSVASPQTPPASQPPTKMKMKSKLKNPFKTGQNKLIPPGPPGPPGIAASSPIVRNPSKKLPLSFLRKNQSLLFKSPRFSSTPIRPFTKPIMSTIPEKLFKNTEVSITLSSEHGKSGDQKVATLDEDMPVIIDEVKGNTSATEVDIKDELPKGISITKQMVTVTNTAKVPDKAKAPVKPVKNTQVKVPAYVKKMTGKGHKKIIGGKLKKKDLKRKAFPVVNKSKIIPKKASKAATNVDNDVSGRRTSSRLSTATYMTYNEDVIESSVFDKKQEVKKNKVEKNEVTKDVPKSRDTVETEQHRKLLNSSKKLMIPLKKVQGDKFATESKPIQVNSKEPARPIKPVKNISQLAGSAVKVTKKVINSNPQESTLSKAQDPPKTLAEKFQFPGSNKEITVSITRSPAVSLSSIVEPDQELLTCYICKQTKDKEQRSLNLKNVFYVRSHISKCLYNVGKLFKAIPPGKENSDKNGIPVDEFGLKNGVWYNCEVEGCWLAQKKGVSGQVCYKVYAIHMASQHGALEMVMMEDGDKARELVDKLMDFEEKKKKGDTSSTKVKSALSIVKMEKSVDVTVEENSFVDVKTSEIVVSSSKPPKPPVATSSRKSLPPSSKHPSPNLGKDGLHNCFLCSGVGGSNKKDGQGLNFKDLTRLKDHYSKCLYNESKYVKFVPPGDHNSDDVGNPIDELGVGYRCEIKGCWLQKKAGDQGKVCYKVLAHHMASQHGVLEKILDADSRPFMKELLKGMKEVGQSKSALVGCRFEQCSKLQFKADNKREIKLHYAGTHFSDWFRVNPETGVPENFSKSGNRAVCETCTGSSDKPVYIQGEKEAIRGHLVVKHDKLADVLIQAGETVKEAREVISDLYPDRLTDVYMDTLDKHTLPLNEDFMSKISL